MTSVKINAILVGLSLIGIGDVGVRGQPSFQAVKMTDDGSPIQIGNTYYYPIRINNSLQGIVSSTNFSTLEAYTSIWQEQTLGDHEHAYYTQDNSIQVLPTFPNAHRQVPPVGTACLIARGWGFNQAALSFLRRHRE